MCSRNHVILATEVENYGLNEMCLILYAFYGKKKLITPKNLNLYKNMKLIHLY